MDELKNFLKRSFGKEKEDRAHAVTMLIIYSVFLIFTIAVIRMMPAKDTKNKENNNSNSQVNQHNDTIKSDYESTKSSTKNNKESFDINYSYSYTITFDGKKEVYLGKKIDDKEKFSYIKDNVTTEYAILNGNCLILENGTYHLTDSLNTYFRYCGIEKIISLLEDQEYVEEGNKYIFSFETIKLFSVFGDTLKSGNNGLNRIELEFNESGIRGINLNLDNYISGVLGEAHTLNIKMEFANIGTTEDFAIKVG